MRVYSGGGLPSGRTIGLLMVDAEGKLITNADGSCVGYLEEENCYRAFESWVDMFTAESYYTDLITAWGSRVLDWEYPGSSWEDIVVDGETYRIVNDEGKLTPIPPTKAF